MSGFNQSARATASAASSTPTFLELPSSAEGMRKQDNERPSVDPEKQTVRDGNRALSAASPPDHSLSSDVIFIAVAVSGQLMGQGQIGTVMIPAELLGNWLGTGDHGEYSWFSASYTLTVGLFVMVGGAAGDILSPKVCFVAGFALMALLNLASGFCRSPIAFDVCRGLAGIGGALVTPNAAALLGKRFRPHSARRTAGFAVLGALAPVGFNIGAAMASLIGVRVGAAWIFWITAIACAVFAVLGQVVLPSGGGDTTRRFDWVGATLGTAGMTLVCFAWNQAPLVGWEVPYVPTLLAVGLILLGAFVLWESRMGESSLVPLSIFTKEVLLVLLALWWGWMSFGIFLFYTSAFIRDVRGFSNPLVITAQMATLVPFGATAALTLIWLFPRVAGHWLLATSLLAFTLGNLLMALAPTEQSFWAQIFPAEILVVFGPDFSYASGALIIANSTSDSLQGVAAGLTLLIVNYSMSIGLGMAGTIERYVSQGDVLRGYRAAFTFATCLGFVGFLVVVAFVRTTRGGFH